MAVDTVFDELWAPHGAYDVNGIDRMNAVILNKTREPVGKGGRVLLFTLLVGQLVTQALIYTAVFRTSSWTLWVVCQGSVAERSKALV